MIGIFYGTDTFFSFENARDNAKNHYGQFVLIGGLVFAIVMLCSCIALDLYKRYPYVVLYYNVIWFAMYMAAGVIVLNMWEGSLVHLNNRKGGGIAVGTFCLINCGVFTDKFFDHIERL
ncbi:hypothetical protein Anas_02626, partial [Armadillidium nasatum]